MALFTSTARALNGAGNTLIITFAGNNITFLAGTITITITSGTSTYTYTLDTVNATIQGDPTIVHHNLIADGVPPLNSNVSLTVTIGESVYTAGADTNDIETNAAVTASSLVLTTELIRFTTVDAEIEFRSILPSGSTWGAGVAADIDTSPIDLRIAPSVTPGQRDVRAVSIVSGSLLREQTNAAATFRAYVSGDALDHPEYNQAHAGESVETLAINANILSDGSNNSGALIATRKVLNGSTTAMPKPIAMWAFAPFQIYTGDIEVLVDAFSRYGIASVEITISDGVDTFSKSVTSRTTVNLGTRHYPTNSCDLYRVVITSAELAANSIDNTDCTLHFRVTDTLGNERSNNTGDDADPKPWPIRNDQANSYTNALSVAYVDQRSSVAINTPIGGDTTFHKGDRIEAVTSNPETVPVIGYVTQDISTSGTLFYVQINPASATNRIVENTATITSFTAGSDNATGVTATASADATSIAGINDGTLDNINDPFPNLSKAGIALANANNTASIGKHAAGTYRMKSPFTFMGNPAFDFLSSPVDSPSWGDIEVAEGFTNSDVVCLGSGGIGDAQSWASTGFRVHLKGAHKYVQVNRTTASGGNPGRANFIGIGSTDDGVLFIDDIEFTVDTAADILQAQSLKGVFIYSLKAQDDGRVSLSGLGTRATNRESNAFGLISRGMTYIGIDGSADMPDFFIAGSGGNGNKDICVLNTVIRKAQGANLGQHYDTIQASGVGKIGNAIFHNLIDRNNRYQHIFLGQGVGEGMAIVNDLAEIADDSDRGSVTLSLGNSVGETIEHLVVAHCTFLDESAAATAESSK